MSCLQINCKKEKKSKKGRKDKKNLDFSFLHFDIMWVYRLTPVCQRDVLPPS